MPDAPFETASESGTISVTGNATVIGQPDELRLFFTIDKVRKSSADALNDVAQRSALLEDICDELSIEMERRKTLGVSVHENLEYDEKKKKRLARGHRATNSITLRLTEAETASRLIARAVTEAQATVLGPTWHLTRANPVHIEAWRQAALSAREKAQAIAEGLRVKLGPPKSVSEPHFGYAYRDRPLLGRFASGGEEVGLSAGVPIHEGTHEVSARIGVVFSLRST